MTPGALEVTVRHGVVCRVYQVLPEETVEERGSWPGRERHSLG